MPLARRIFHPADDALLDYIVEDGKSIEPSWYLPVLPLLLVNGSEGIGTGESHAMVLVPANFFQDGARISLHITLLISPITSSD
jgi:DNA gyrase/topoisomerase IV subunit A